MMDSNNIVNSQESTTILNACTKKSGNLSYAPRTRQYMELFNCVQNEWIVLNRIICIK